jgi:hypothetical protein
MIRTAENPSLPSTLEAASLKAVDLLEEAETSPIIVGSYELELRHTDKPFRGGKMWLAHIRDIDDGLLRAVWFEQMQDSGLGIVFDYEWSIKDPGHRWVEVEVVDYGDVEPEKSEYCATHGRIPMNDSHISYLNKCLSRLDTEGQG